MNSGAYLPLEDGTDLRMSLVLEDSAGDPIDLTGGTVDVVDGNGAETDVVTVTVTDAASGKASIARDYDANLRRINFHIRYIDAGGRAIVWPVVRVVYQ